MRSPIVSKAEEPISHGVGVEPYSSSMRSSGGDSAGQQGFVAFGRPPRAIRQRERAARRRDLAGPWTSQHALQALTALVAPGLASRVLSMPEHFDKVSGAVDFGIRVDLSTLQMPEDIPEFVVDVMDLAAFGVWDAQWAFCTPVPEAVSVAGSEPARAGSGTFPVGSWEVGSQVP
mmetsp:Transcript_81005/g.216279  ORF Transcript_81005/g.216279 Transcript_81005/m.216279 type:complete len:175 (+) Transcript_81005:122-646(+)